MRLKSNEIIYERKKYTSVIDDSKNTYWKDVAGQVMPVYISHKLETMYNRKTANNKKN